MKRIIGLCLVTVLVFSGFGLGGVKTQTEDELRDFEKNARWYFSSEDLKTASPIYKIMDAVVGVPVKSKFFVINNQKVNVSYRLGFDLTDNGNREAWMEGDRKSLQLDKSKFTLKPGQKQDVTVTVTVNRSHSGHAFWTLNIIPDKGAKDNVFLYICQFDTKAEITSNYTPPKVKTMTELLKYRTKIGYIIKNDCFTIVVYGNKHVCCFNRQGSMQWVYSNKETIQDFFVHSSDGCDKDPIISCEGIFLNPENGESEENNGGYRNTLVDGRNSLLEINFIQPRWFCCKGSCMLFGKQYLSIKVNWARFSDLTSYRMAHVFNSVPNRFLYYRGPIEFFPGNYECIDPRDGKIIFETVPGPIPRGYTFIDDKNKLVIAKGEFIDSRRHGHGQVWDVERGVNLLDVTSCGPTRSTLSGNLMVFSDFKSTDCFDYIKRKRLWTLTGDGAPLCEPYIDEKQDFVYILDEDSIWSSEEYEAKLVKEAKFVRLYKFNLRTGKKIWETKIFSIPKGTQGFYDHEVMDLGTEFGWKNNNMAISNGVIKIELDSKYTFTIRASDGTFVK